MEGFIRADGKVMTAEGLRGWKMSEEEMVAWFRYNRWPEHQIAAWLEEHKKWK